MTALAVEETLTSHPSCTHAACLVSSQVLDYALLMDATLAGKILDRTGTFCN